MANNKKKSSESEKMAPPFRNTQSSIGPGNPEAREGMLPPSPSGGVGEPDGTWQGLPAGASASERGDENINQVLQLAALLMPMLRGGALGAAPRPEPPMPEGGMMGSPTNAASKATMFERPSPSSLGLPPEMPTSSPTAVTADIKPQDLQMNPLLRRPAIPRGQGVGEWEGMSTPMSMKQAPNWKPGTVVQSDWPLTSAAPGSPEHMAQLDAQMKLLDADAAKRFSSFKNVKPDLGPPPLPRNGTAPPNSELSTASMQSPFKKKKVVGL